jgi:hypothetical protein
VHEHVFAVGTAEEAESLCIVKPFHCSLFHNYSFVGGVSLNSSGIALRVERNSRTGKNAKSDSTTGYQYSILRTPSCAAGAVGTASNDFPTTFENSARFGNPDMNQTIEARSHDNSRELAVAPR